MSARLRKSKLHGGILPLLFAMVCAGVLLYGAAAYWDMPTRQAILLLFAILCSLLPLELPIEVHAVLRQAANSLKRIRMSSKELSAIPTLGAATIVFADMGGVVDPAHPRYKQVLNAVEAARRAHIKVVLLTDYNLADTTRIAQHAHLVKHLGDLRVVSGDAMQKLGNAQLMRLLENGKVIFSRLSGKDRARAVGLAQKKGHIVAFMGYASDDVTALLQADIAIAVGNKADSSLSRTADIAGPHADFVTVVHAIQQGRAALQAARKAITISLTAHSSELGIALISIFALGLFHVPIALTGLEILAINLLIGLFPILALSKDPDPGELSAKSSPGPARQGFTGHEIRDLVWCGMLIGGLAFLNYLWFFERNNITGAYLASGSPIHMQATTLTFLTIVLCQLMNVLQRRTDSGILQCARPHNRMLWVAMAGALFCTVIVIYSPWIASFFGTRPLDMDSWLYAAGAALLFGLIREFQRYSARHHRQTVLELHHTLHPKTAA